MSLSASPWRDAIQSAAGNQITARDLQWQYKEALAAPDKVANEKGRCVAIRVAAGSGKFFSLAFSGGSEDFVDAELF